MNRLRRFMYGRYGFDQLARTLIIISMLLTLISSFTRFIPLYALAYMLLIYSIFRGFSRNIQKRTREYQIYYQMTSSFKRKLQNLLLLLMGTKTHKYYRCSRCKQTIRVPRGRGRISISCPKCKMEFIKRT